MHAAKTFQIGSGRNSTLRLPKLTGSRYCATDTYTISGMALNRGYEDAICRQY